ncbi:hypothetical protein GALMADRAFT_236093 [Galerina marginata CBS 339.88]|uniref:chitin deacetylase n=1 Tax=Galerina marginata (strain CBS 339.88) TaxID=685588 RepID=A0A067TKH4_GALM3|nr:hypothetical protein GALMADRAFT_236093 [Galerina marginata CBS 339.88]
MILPLISLFSLLLARTAAVPTPTDSHDHAHSHSVRQALPDSWYQPRDHSVHALFKRATSDGVNYAAVGTPAWSAGFPQTSPDPNALPAAWVSALNAAVAAGKIPAIPTSSNMPGVNPVYPAGNNPSSPQICSATYKCVIPGDIWDAPDGVFASSFDDGPTPSTPQLVQFLQSNNVSTTHFMIGINILNNPTQFLTAFNAGHDIAVHTWTHPYMTTLSNLDVVGQLGWTMQMIHNSTGGRVPRYWRPPYGDSDMRVRSIALEVFGLETVIWNHDTSDWNGTPDSIQANMVNFLGSPKHPGLVILEHELTGITVGGFMTAFPLIKSNGWNFASLAQVIGNGRTYQNANSSTSDDVQPDNILFPSTSSSSSSSPTPTPGSTGSTPPASASSASQSTPAAKSSASRDLHPLRSAYASLLIAGVTGAIVLCS